MTLKLSEEVDNIYYEYDKTKSLLDQVIYSLDNIHLINVRKTYTNGIYFGVNWTVLIKENNNSYMAHNFQCKDRGYSEDVVDDWEKFSKLKPLDDILNFTPRIKERKPVAIKQDIKIPPICDRQFDVYFVYDEGTDIYRFTNLQDNNGVFRGLYSAQSDESYEEKVKDFGIAIPAGRNPNFSEIKHLWNQANISFSNVITFINTGYSKIKIVPNNKSGIRSYGKAPS